VFNAALDNTGMPTSSLSVAAMPGGHGMATLTSTIEALSVTVPNYDFGTVGARFGGKPTESVKVMASGARGTAATVTGAALKTGSSFSITSDGCKGVLLHPADSCSLLIQFDPSITAPGNYPVDTLTVTVDHGHSSSGTISGASLVDFALVTIDPMKVDENIATDASITSSGGLICSMSSNPNGCDLLYHLPAPSITLTVMSGVDLKFGMWMGIYCNGSTTPTCTFTPNAGSSYVNALFQ
jgi:hypothetical protein